MSFRIRASRPDDLPALYEMAKLTGGGFTNLPPEKSVLEAKLGRSAEALARQQDRLDDDLVVLVLEEVESGQVRGTCQLFSQVGLRVPFYSYRIGTLTQYSQALQRTFRAELLTLCTDFEGASEVGGLFLHPSERAGGLGALIARSRYLYIRRHRPRFANTLIAELRGVIDEAGGSPFWDGLAGKFFGMNFQEADEFNATNGHQFIADLFPKHPIYTALLPDSARAVVGVPHPTGRPAMRMLEAEGLSHDRYIDIFDGGPTVHAPTDRVTTVAAAEEVEVREIGAVEAPRRIASVGRLADFRAAYVRVADGMLDAEDAKLLGVEPGMTLLVAP